MTLKKKALLFILFLSLFAPNLYAEDVKFQLTSEEMIKELTREPVKYRSFNVKKRGIKVLERIENKTEEKIIIVETQNNIPKLNLMIQFDYNSSMLKSNSFKLLKELGIALKSDQLKNKTIMINGHTDSDGGETYNQKLSLERANAVRLYLFRNHNISKNRLKIRGYGESCPLKENTNLFNKQINRRVEFEIAKNS